MEGLALAILIYLGVGAVWDIIEPDAITFKFNSPARLLTAFCAQVAIIVLCLVVLGATGPAFLAVGGAYVALAALGVAAR